MLVYAARSSRRSLFARSARIDHPMASTRMMSARVSPSLGRPRRGAKPALASRPIVRASAQGKGSTDDYVVTLVNIAVTAGNEEGFVAQSVDNASNSVEVTVHPTKPTEPTEPTARSHSNDTIDRSTVPTHNLD